MEKPENFGQSCCSPDYTAATSTYRSSNQPKLQPAGPPLVVDTRSSRTTPSVLPSCLKSVTHWCSHRGSSPWPGYNPRHSSIVERRSKQREKIKGIRAIILWIASEGKKKKEKKKGRKKKRKEKKKKKKRKEKRGKERKTKKERREKVSCLSYHFHFYCISFIVVKKRKKKEEERKREEKIKRKRKGRKKRGIIQLWYLFSVCL